MNGAQTVFTVFSDATPFQWNEDLFSIPYERNTSEVSKVETFYSFVKVLRNRSFYVSLKKNLYSQIIAQLQTKNPIRCSSWEGSLHSTPNPSNLQMSSINPAFPKSSIQTYPTELHLHFSPPASFNLLDCFPSQAFGTSRDVNTPLSCFDQ